MARYPSCALRIVLFSVIIGAPVCVPETLPAQRSRPIVIAHRGASGYAPEHTLAAYRLAIEQGADFVEQDLQITRDGVLICLHDPDLSRTTNVADVFPDGAKERDVAGSGKPKRGWYAIDFTLKEIKRLDAGSWFNRLNSFAANPSYVGQRVPTLDEAVDLVGDRAGLYIELKYYAFYKSQGFDGAAKLTAVLRKRGFENRLKLGRIFVQSFWKEGLLRMRELAPEIRRVQLLPMEDPGRENNSAVVTPALAREIAGYCTGVGPSKAMLKTQADVEILHAAGLLIHPYTFRGSVTAVLRRPLDKSGNARGSLRDEIVADIRRYVEMGIDGGFTDYPAVWREAIK